MYIYIYILLQNSRILSGFSSPPQFACMVTYDHIVFQFTIYVCFQVAQSRTLGRQCPHSFVLFPDLHSLSDFSSVHILLFISKLTFTSNFSSLHT